MPHYRSDSPGEGKPLPRREQRKNEFRAVIEKASREVFLERGYAGVGVNEIARLAGVSKRTLYSYYPSKLALFIHVFDEYLQELTERIMAAASGDASVRQRLVKALRALFDFTRENEKFMWLYWMLDSGEAGGVLPRELLDHVKAWTKTMFDAIIELIAQGQEEGVIADLDPRLLAHLMSALNKGIIVHTNKERRFEIEDIDAESLQALSIELLDGGLFHGIGEASKGEDADKTLNETRTTEKGKSSTAKKVASAGNTARAGNDVAAVISGTEARAAKAGGAQGAGKSGTKGKAGTTGKAGPAVGARAAASSGVVVKSAKSGKARPAGKAGKDSQREKAS